MTKISEETVLQIKMSHVIAFVSGLFSAILLVGGFFYSMLNSKVEEKVDQKLFELDKTYINQKFQEQNMYIQKLDVSIQSINTDIKTILMENNRRPSSVAPAITLPETPNPGGN